MKRNPFFFLLIVIISSSCTKVSVKERPNVIIINIDDMGWKDVGYMGSGYYETPHIDNLASQGMQFTNAYAASANCAPSRASLLTGKWTTRHGIYTVGSSERGKSEDRKLIPTKNTKILSTRHQVLPELMQMNGYTTCHAGKWHLSDDPMEYGFDVNIGGGGNGYPHSYYPPYKNVAISGGDDQHLSDVIMEQTIGFIDTVSHPFFLHYAPYAVHTPIQPVKTLLDKYEEKPASGGQDNALYATMVENIDRNIGLLVAKLKDRDLYRNTVLIFTSDNGGLYGVTNQYPLRAGKGSYYEGGIRVPFFILWKDQVRGKSKSDTPITHLDIFPTVLQVTGANANEPLDGNTLMPLLMGEVSDMDRALFWHFPVYLQKYKAHNSENRDTLFRTRPGSVVRHGKWKLHYYFEHNEMELFNLDDDIGERTNLVEEMPDKAGEMLLLLKKWWKSSDAPIPTELNPAYCHK